VQVARPRYQLVALAVALLMGFASASLAYWQDVQSLTPGAPPVHLNLRSLAFGLFFGIPLSMVLAVLIYPRFRCIPLAAVCTSFGYIFRAKGGIEPRFWQWSPRGLLSYLDSTPLQLALLSGAVLCALLIPLIKIGRRASADMPKELCQSCGYTREALRKCPECGAPNPHSAAEDRDTA
jgi:hypothetical protein